jgi:SAM-dependent methyltransferase
MGIDVHGLRFLEHALRKNGPMNSTLTIGHQNVQISNKELQDYLGVPGSPASFAQTYADDLLIEQFGATTVASIDASEYEEATYVRDLNVPLEESFPEFDSVVDGGSMEHIFDIRASFENIMRCCRVGGQILHIVPANNFVGHGFYQFSPEFFFSLYSKSNGFAETEVYLADLGKPNVWWRVEPPSGNSRSTALSSYETYALVRTKKVLGIAGAYSVQQSDYVATWETGIPPVYVPSNFYRRIRKKVGDRLPTSTKARLMQIERRVSSGMRSRNPALTRVRPPCKRTQNSLVPVGSV